MSKMKSAMLIALGLAVVAGTVAVITPPNVDNEAPAATKTSGPAAGGRWLAVAPGRVEPRSGLIKLSAPVVGLVGHVPVKANDTVFAGEPLIRLNDEELKARLAAAEAQVTLRRRQRLDQQSSGRSDERRRAEDAVADAEKAEFDAQAAVDAAAARWRASGVPDTALTQARAALAKAQDDLQNRKARLHKIEAEGPLPTAVEAQLIAARADLSAARAALERVTVRAPIDGTVLQVNVKVGELATPSAAQPLMLLANISALRVRAELDERDVSDIKIGQVASIRAPAFPGQDFTGRVSFVASLVERARLAARDPANRTDVDAVEVVIDLTQPGPLAVGMNVDVYFDRKDVAGR
jgi:HlyD family secretion protein